MTSTKILATSLCALLAAACSKDQAPSSAAPGTMVPTAGAVRVHGDLIPASVVHISLPKPGTTTLISGSDALAPGKPFSFDMPPMVVTGRDFRRVMQGTDSSKFTFPIDAPAGAKVLVRSMSKGVNIASVHMHDVVTGTRLDRARDVDAMAPLQRNPMDPSGINKGGPAADGSGVTKNNPSPPDEPNKEMFRREPGFTPLSLPTRQLSVDVPYAGGLVQLDLPADVARAGVIVEVQEPNSRITLSGAPDEMVHGYGETVLLNYSVANGDQGLDGATLSGWAELSGHAHGVDFTFRSLGSGQYQAQIPLTAVENVGTWGLHVTATGVTSSGAPYERSIETAFAYQPAHAQMSAVSVPRILRGSDGLIDGVDVDVQVQSLEDDRFSVRGTLTWDAPDGTEHSLASAQTGQTLNAGTGTMTLHFTADSMALAQVPGPFHVRDLALVSQAFGLTQHRLGRGLDLTTGAIAANEIRYPQVLSIQAQDLMQNGDLQPRRQQ